VENSTNVNGDILNSWKEIARYLERGVRTVQRWERDLQLPVRRPRGKRRSAVLALRKEIDAWLGNCPQVASDPEQGDLTEPSPFQPRSAGHLSHLRWETQAR